MDTQSSLRVNSIQSPNSQPAAARNRDSGGFDQHLHDQMQQAETAAPPARASAGEPAQAEKTETQACQGGQPETAGEEETVDAGELAVASEPMSGLVNDLELAATLVTGTPQDLPQDGNVLPAVIAGLPSDPNLPQDANGLPVIVATVLAGDEAGKATPPEAVPMPDLDDNGPGALAQYKLAQADGNPVSENTWLPGMKLQIKSADAVSDRQTVSLITEANKAQVISMQQVLAITGSAAANVHTYMPPQFDAASVMAAGFTGQISTPVSHPAWGNQVGEQLAFMLHGKFQMAEIKLNPAHLGPMEIHLSLKDDQASVTFVSAHAPVRDALDAALPRLRDLLEQQGLSLANVDVSAYSNSQREAPGQQDNQTPGLVSDDQPEQIATQSVTPVQIETGLSVFV